MHPDGYQRPPSPLKGLLVASLGGSAPPPNPGPARPLAPEVPVGGVRGAVAPPERLQELFRHPNQE
eukprot:3635877-Alexandrium_andersonii.AAC.1